MDASGTSPPWMGKLRIHSIWNSGGMPGSEQNDEGIATQRRCHEILKLVSKNGL